MDDDGFRPCQSGVTTVETPAEPADNDRCLLPSGTARVGSSLSSAATAVPGGQVMGVRNPSEDGKCDEPATSGPA